MADVDVRVHNVFDLSVERGGEEVAKRKNSGKFVVASGNVDVVDGGVVFDVGKNSLADLFDSFRWRGEGDAVGEMVDSGSRGVMEIFKTVFGSNEKFFGIHSVSVANGKRSGGGK